jgi:hypothetical protein
LFKGYLQMSGLVVNRGEEDAEDEREDEREALTALR